MFGAADELAERLRSTGLVVNVLPRRSYFSRTRRVPVRVSPARTGRNQRISHLANGVWRRAVFDCSRATKPFASIVGSGPNSTTLHYNRNDRFMEAGDVVVAEGAVQAALTTGGRVDALFCDVFHFRGDKISRLVSYLVDRCPAP